MIKVLGKLGTHPSDGFEVKGNGVPCKGQRVLLRSKNDQRCLKWTEAIVEKVDRVPSFNDFYFFSLA